MTGVLWRETALPVGLGMRPEASLLVKKGEGEQRVWVSNLRAVKGNEALTRQELWSGEGGKGLPRYSATGLRPHEKVTVRRQLGVRMHMCVRSYVY